MDSGMLWFDNDASQAVESRVNRAADYYRRKYGQAASLCFVHPSMLDPADPAEKRMAGAVELRTASWVLPNHFFIGSNGLETEAA